MPDPEFFDAVDPDEVFVPNMGSYWCESERTAWFRSWLAMRDIPTYVNGLVGDVRVTLARSGRYEIDPEDPVPCPASGGQGRAQRPTTP